jgi:hypothetical protein
MLELNAQSNPKITRISIPAIILHRIGHEPRQLCFFLFAHCMLSAADLQHKVVNNKIHTAVISFSPWLSLRPTQNLRQWILTATSHRVKWAGVKLTTHLHIEPWLTAHAAIPPPSYMLYDTALY